MISRDTPLKAIFEAAKEVGISEEQLSFLPDEPEKLLACFSTSPAPHLAEAAVQLGKNCCGLVLAPMLSYPMLGNSDHYPFSQIMIPSILFNTERHVDLHQPSDTVEKINVDKMTRVVKLVYTLAFSVADAPRRPKWKSQ